MKKIITITIIMVILFLTLAVVPIIIIKLYSTKLSEKTINDMEVFYTISFIISLFFCLIYFPLVYSFKKRLMKKHLKYTNNYLVASFMTIYHLYGDEVLKENTLKLIKRGLDVNSTYKNKSLFSYCKDKKLIQTCEVLIKYGTKIKAMENNIQEDNHDKFNKNIKTIYELKKDEDFINYFGNNY